LDYHQSRHAILVSNVAHAETPGYVPRDLRREPTFSSSLGVALQRTAEGHMSLSEIDIPEGMVTAERDGAGLDGNGVSLDREAAKLAANQSRYDVVATLLSAEMRMLAFAANDGAGA